MSTGTESLTQGDMKELNRFIDLFSQGDCALRSVLRLAVATVVHCDAVAVTDGLLDAMGATRLQPRPAVFPDDASHQAMLCTVLVVNSILKNFYPVSTAAQRHAPGHTSSPIPGGMLLSGATESHIRTAVEAWSIESD